MKGKTGCCLWSSVFLLQVAFMLVYSNAKQCKRTGKTFSVLGVFDDNDTTAIGSFRRSVEDLDKLVIREPDCPPKVTHTELLLHTQMSAIEVINATRNVLSGEDICYVIYSSYAGAGRFILDYALNSEIPVVSTIPKKYVYDPAKVINLNERSSRLTKMQVILAFLSKYDHKEFVAITGADFDDMSVVSLLRQELSQHNLVMVDWFIIPNGSYHDVANRTREKIRSLQGDVSFLMITNNILLSEMIVYSIISTKDSADMASRRNFQWILASDLDFDVINRAVFDPASIYIICPKPINQWLSNSDYVQDAIGMLKYSMKEWIVDSSGSCPSIREIQRHLPKIAFHGKTGFVKFTDERERLYGVYDIIEKHPPQPPVTSPLGFYNGGLISINDQYQAPMVKIVIIEYAPYIITQPKISPDEPCKSNALSCFRVVKTTKGEERHERCCYGFVIDILRMVAGRLQFTPDLVFNDDGIYGTQDSNGSWNGIVQDIITGKADMSPDLFPSSPRAKVLDFTEPYMPSGIALLVKESKRQEKKIYWTSYMRPFTATLWYVFVGSVGVMVVALWIIEKFNPSMTDGKVYHWNVAFCLDNAVCYVLQLAFGRPADEKKPMSNGARLSSLMFGVAMMILIASYSANLAAFLIVNEMTTPVESIYDKKIENPAPDFKYGTLDGSYMSAFFKNSENEYFSKIWHIKNKNNVKSLSEGVQNVRTGELDVFIGDTVSLKYEALKDPHCELKVVGQPFAMSGASFAVKKGSKWSASLSVVLSKLKAQGMTDFIEKSWVQKFTCYKEVPPVQLHFKDLSGLFLQLLIGMLLCILVTFCYLGWKKLHPVYYRKCEGERDVVEDVDMNAIEPFKETCI